MGEHYDDGGECLWPGRTGLRECVPRIFFFALHRVAADQAEALRVWSAVGVFGGAGHSGAVGGLEVSVSCSSREYTGL